MEAFDFFASLSNLWARSAYSTLYAIPGESRSGLTKVLFEDVDYVRSTVEKYQIPKDINNLASIIGKNKVDLYRSDGTFSREYDVKNPHRAIIPPIKIADDGSICWNIIDLHHSQSRWLSRRSLADRYLDLLDQNGSESTEES